MKKFQYESTIVMNGEDAIGELNNWGEEGWEVIDVFRPTGCTIFMMKREMPIDTHLHVKVNNIHDHPATRGCTSTCPYFGTPLQTSIKGS